MRSHLSRVSEQLAVHNPGYHPLHSVGATTTGVSGTAQPVTGAIITLISFAAVLVPDALGILEDVEIGR